MFRLRNLLPVSLIVLCASIARAELSVGDKAPGFDISHWVKGDPVKIDAAGDEVVVVEFWATWCPPCIQAIPHLTSLQKRFADQGLHVVSVTEHDLENTLDRVKSFVTSQGDKMNYTVAFDQDGKTSMRYMSAAGIDSIPYAFVVDQKGRLAWMGYPDDELDEAVAQILAGTYDVDQAAKVFKLVKRMDEALMERDWAGTIKLADEVLALDAQHLRAMETKFWATSFDDEKAARALAPKVLTLAGDRADFLSGFAWQLLNNPSTEGKFYEVAVAAAQRANELSKFENWDHLDTLASVRFAVGDRDKAIEYGEKAIKLCDSSSVRAMLLENLERYKKGS